MRLHLFCILMGIVLLSACREDEILPAGEEQTEISDPVEIDLGLIEGNVKDTDDNLLNEVVVNLYDSEGLVETQVTDSDGYFQFIVEEIKDYYVHFHSNVFSQTLIEVNPEDSNAFNLEIELLPAFFFGGNDIVWGNFDWVKLDGFVFEGNGQVAENVKVIAFGNFGQIVNYTCTNQDGYYNVLVPSGSDIHLEINPECGYASEIPIVTDTESDTTLDPTYLEDSQEQIIFSGTVTDCDNQPVMFEELIFEFHGFSKIGVYAETVQVVNGSYELNYESCEEIFQIYVSDANTGQILQDIHFDEWENNSVFNFEMCDIFLNLVSLMEITIDGQEINIDKQFFATYDGESISVFGDVDQFNSNFIFSFASPDLPVQNPLYTEALFLASDDAFYYQDDPLQLNITNYPDEQFEKLEGNITGLIIDSSSGESKQLECHFEVIALF